MLTCETASEDGAVAGVEMLPFGVLVFVGWTLLAANAWGVVDAKMATAAAAREGARAYVEAPSRDMAPAAAESAAGHSLTASGRRATPRVEISGEFRRCARVAVTVAYDVPALRLPWSPGLGTTTVRSTASEVVDPLRAGVPGEADCV